MRKLSQYKNPSKEIRELESKKSKSKVHKFWSTHLNPITMWDSRKDKK